MVIETPANPSMAKYKQYFLLHGGSLHNSIALSSTVLLLAFANSFESFVYDCVCLLLYE
jgi:hypothetical protein